LAPARANGIVVVGGGPAGLAAAFWLRQRGHAVVVVERSDYTDVRIGEHLPPSAARYLEGLGSQSGMSLADHLTSSGVDAYWGTDAPSHTDYFLQPGQHGINLSRPRFDADFARACEAVGARVLRSSSVKRAERRESGWEIDVSANGSISTLTASFVVDASGRAAGFARRRGAKIHADDDLIALAAFGRARQTSCSTRSLIESTELGWWYHAPIGSDQTLCIFFVDGDLLPRMRMPLLFDWWRENLAKTKQLSTSIQACEGSGRLHIRSARSQRLEPLHGDGWMAIGDAATAFDPLSSRGITKGLAHGERAAAAISGHLSGDDSALRQLSGEIGDEYLEYLKTRKGYYHIEMRWPDSVFWKRHHLG
jgi:flavin-dependent dehydrogenase